MLVRVFREKAVFIAEKAETNKNTQVHRLQDCLDQMGRITRAVNSINC